MLFGHTHKITVTAFILLSATLFQLACNNKVANYITFKNPLQGESFNSGKPVKIELDIPEKTEIQTISYWVDGKQFAEKTNKEFVTLDTQNLPLGYRMLTAIVKSGDQTDTITNNIILTTDKKPAKLKYTLVNTFPHDTSSYTQGLSFVDGKLLESTGRKGQSHLKYVDLKSGKAIKSTALKPEYFGEGSVKVGNKIIVLTWEENVGLVYDSNTFEEIATFPYQASRQGWGLTYDGKQLLRSDGSNKIWFMNAETYREEGFIEVYDNKGPVERLNELEFINGMLYANVYGSNKIVVINTNTGIVEAEVDLSKLVPKNFFKDDYDEANNVLNGIAYDVAGKRLFVTGKKWPNLFEIKLSEK
ncbi:MAG: glutaminyl-peptide cyclotransferase [Pedobacter sp.]|uniref:glutaminyl-peptide cyclotransferase n=1 Tax=Pedobacter sp. TaxID=1411316 RepID=UPI0028081A3B|nr:glutaminyl-peptide cyclotransferase [Pedobacter sp.]MDQ8004445.1 glutaminyl-peptide cyclotransferase [Pedobacter sp.]